MRRRTLFGGKWEYVFSITNTAVTLDNYDNYDSGEIINSYKTNGSQSKGVNCSITYSSPSYSDAFGLYYDDGGSISRRKYGFRIDPLYWTTNDTNYFNIKITQDESNKEISARINLQQPYLPSIPDFIFGSGSSRVVSANTASQIRSYLGNSNYTIIAVGYDGSYFSVDQQFVGYYPETYYYGGKDINTIVGGTSVYNGNGNTYTALANINASRNYWYGCSKSGKFFYARKSGR